MRRIFIPSILIILLIAAFLPVFGQDTSRQQEKPLTLNDILSKLTFTSRISKTNEEINEQLISNIRKRGVRFLLSEEDKSSIIEARGTEELIKTINKNFCEEPVNKKLKDKNTLYQKFVSNYDGDFNQKKIALEAAREYLVKYGQKDADPEDKNLLEYFRSAIPFLERQTRIDY